MIVRVGMPPAPIVNEWRFLSTGEKTDSFHRLGLPKKRGKINLAQRKTPSALQTLIKESFK